MLTKLLIRLALRWRCPPERETVRVLTVDVEDVREYLHRRDDDEAWWARKLAGVQG